MSQDDVFIRAHRKASPDGPSFCEITVCLHVHKCLMYTAVLFFHLLSRSSPLSSLLGTLIILDVTTCTQEHNEQYARTHATTYFLDVSQERTMSGKYAAAGTVTLKHHNRYSITP